MPTADRISLVRRSLLAAVGAAISAALLVVAFAADATPAAAASTAPSQPTQASSGPGESSYPYQDVRMTLGGRGATAYAIFEPASPRPSTAPVTVVTHGYGEYSGYRMNGAFARHTALTGSIVIYPRWRTSLTPPCPGPFLVQPCIDAETKAIKSALAFLRSHSDHVQPEAASASYFGFSFGGIITADIANRWKKLGLPKPQAVFLDDPHDGGFTVDKEHALDRSLAGIPSTTKFVCHVGAEGVTTKSTGYSCGAIFPRLGHIPAANKSLVMTFPDAHGTPALSSKHGVCAGQASGLPLRMGSDTWTVDTYDWSFCWRTWDALRDCAATGTNCQHALGNTPENRYIGTWSDGVPMIGLKVQTDAPIRRSPVPAREPAPPSGTPVG